MSGGAQLSEFCLTTLLGGSALLLIDPLALGAFGRLDRLPRLLAASRLDFSRSCPIEPPRLLGRHCRAH